MVKYPEDWKVVPLGDVAAITRGGSPRPIQAWLTDSSDGLNWIKIGDVSVGAKYITSTEERIIPLGARYSREVKSGDFILSNSMSFGRPYILKIDGCIHDGWLAIQEYSKSYDTEYLYYILSSEDVFSQYVAMAAGSSVKNLNKDKVSDVKIPLPPLPEQKRIAAVLGNVDKLIDNLSRQIEKKRLVKQGVMQDLLAGKKRLPGFKGEWEEKRLGNCANVFCDGDWIESADQSDRGIRLVQTGNIGEGVFFDKADKKRYVSEETFKRLNCCEIFAGDVLVSRLPDPAGRACLLPLATERRITAVDCTVIRFNDQMAAEYFVQYSQTLGYYRQISEQMAGSTRQRISRNSLGNVVVLCPPTLAEQKAIAKVLGDMDAEIAKLEAKHEKYRQLKQGLMNDLLTGKVRI